MDDSDSQHDLACPAPAKTPGSDPAEADCQGDIAAAGLRGQIAALRQQVKHAQDTLRAHHRRREDRSFEP